ncbi:MAG TPA: metal-dependent hydrolase [Thermoguttaceae bacterium]|nr:metal-dependent hydrolase [Thermoguttaceae bacterium]
MTTYEHAMLGVNGALAAGLDRRWGWPIVAMAGFVAVLPDWDGLGILFGAAVFDRVHRTLGHNLLVCLSLGAVVAALDYRYSLAQRVKECAGRHLRALSSQEPSPKRSVFRLGELSIWVAVGVVASLSHLAADVVFSGHPQLSDWGLRLLWPFSDRLWAYPMVSWGDPGATLVFVVGMFAMIRWRRHRRLIAGLTLTLVLGYVSMRSMIGG